MLGSLLSGKRSLHDDGFNRSLKQLASWRLGPSWAAPKGPPSPSTSRLCFTPALPRSVGLGSMPSLKPGLAGRTIGGLPFPLDTAQLVALVDQFSPSAQLGSMHTSYPSTLATVINRTGDSPVGASQPNGAVGLESHTIAHWLDAGGLLYFCPLLVASGH
jgi:hypothetical protein